MLWGVLPLCSGVLLTVREGAALVDGVPPEDEAARAAATSASRRPLCCLALAAARSASPSAADTCSMEGGGTWAGRRCDVGGTFPTGRYVSAQQISILAPTRLPHQLSVHPPLPSPSCLIPQSHFRACLSARLC